MKDYNHLFKCTSWVKPTPERKPLQASWNVIATYTPPPNEPIADKQQEQQTDNIKDASHKWLLAKKLSNLF